MFVSYAKSPSCLGTTPGSYDFAQNAERCECIAEKRGKAGISVNRSNVKGSGRYLSPMSKMAEKGLIEKTVVYNLSVSGPHEYYANGVLVHNCMALAIYAGSLNQFQLEQRQKTGFSLAWP